MGPDSDRSLPTESTLRREWCSRGAAASARQPLMEVLEDRQLLTASLAPISNLKLSRRTARATRSRSTASGTTDAQNFTVTSSNPAIAAEVAQGEFLDAECHLHRPQQCREQASAARSRSSSCRTAT